MKNPVNNRRSIGTVFTTLLFLVFIMCALFTVLIGARVYENIYARNQQNYSDYVILHYVANKVRQGDRYNGIDVATVEGTPVLELKENAQGTEYVTRIYACDGKLRELFTKDGADLKLDDGLIIADCAGLDIKKDGELLHISTSGANPETLTMDIKCAEEDGL